MSEIVNQLLPLSLIQPHPKNYNSHPPSQIQGLQKSHDRFAQYRSVVVAKLPDGGYVQVAGHGVVEALRAKGVEEVRADILIDYSLEDIEGILSADNLHSQNGNPNQNQLQQLLKSQAQQGHNLAALGLGKQEADRLLSQLLAESKTAFLASALPPSPIFQPQETEVRALPEQKAEQGSDGWVTMSFTVTQKDREIILQALRIGKKYWALDTQAEAMVQIMHQFVASFSPGEG